MLWPLRGQNTRAVYIYKDMSFGPSTQRPHALSQSYYLCRSNLVPTYTLFQPYLFTNMSDMPKPIVTEHLLGVTCKRLDYKDVVASLRAAPGLAAAADAGKATIAPAGGPFAGTEGTPASTRRVQAKNLQKLIDQGFPHAADVLDRAVVTNETDWPWCTVGKVFVGINSNFNAPLWTGSGVMVGVNVMLTAAHVVPWDQPGWWMRFVPAFENGAEPFASSYVETAYGYENTSNVTGIDYAVCKLYTHLGNTVSYMGAYAPGDNNEYYAGSWSSVGYPAEPGTNPGANFMIVEQPVKIIDIEVEPEGGLELESNVYSLGGWSGGPMWNWIGGQPLVIGVLSGRETDPGEARQNVSAGGKPLVDLVIYGRTTWSA